MPGEAPQVMHGDGALEVLTSKPENQPARTNGLDPRRRLTLCGVQRSRRFWLFAFLVSLILVSGLGVGLGVGLGNRSGEPGYVFTPAAVHSLASCSDLIVETLPKPVNRLPVHSQPRLRLQAQHQRYRLARRTRQVAKITGSGDSTRQ